MDYDMHSDADLIRMGLEMLRDTVGERLASRCKMMIDRPPIMTFQGAPILGDAPVDLSDVTGIQLGTAWKATKVAGAPWKVEWSDDVSWVVAGWFYTIHEALAYMRSDECLSDNVD